MQQIKQNVKIIFIFIGNEEYTQVAKIRYSQKTEATIAITK